MHAEADLARDEDAPPPSGVRVRTAALRLRTPLPPADGVVADVAEQVFFEVWSVVRALSPLQGWWLRLGRGALAMAAVEASTWRCPPEGAAKALRERWPALVPGSASLDRLAHLMVDTIWV